MPVMPMTFAMPDLTPDKTAYLNKTFDLVNHLIQDGLPHGCGYIQLRGDLLFLGRKVHPKILRILLVKLKLAN